MFRMPTRRRMLRVRAAQKLTKRGVLQYEPAPVPSSRDAFDALVRLAIIGLAFVILILLIIDLRVWAHMW
jgi:hypothetical protein